MFDTKLPNLDGEGTVENTTVLNAEPQELYQSGMEYFGPPSDWSSVEVDLGSFSQSLTSSPTQLHEPVISNAESAALSSDGITPPILLRKESFPGQEEKVLCPRLSYVSFLAKL